jgi:hypothetical protein
MSTWRFPRFSALNMFFNASFKTLILTMVATGGVYQHRKQRRGLAALAVGRESRKEVLAVASLSCRRPTRPKANQVRVWVRSQLRQCMVTGSAHMHAGID